MHVRSTSNIDHALIRTQTKTEALDTDMEQRHTKIDANIETHIPAPLDLNWHGSAAAAAVADMIDLDSVTHLPRQAGVIAFVLVVAAAKEL